MKISDMKLLMEAYEGWKKLKDQLHIAFLLYKENRKVPFSADTLTSAEAKKEALRFLKIVADLFDSEYCEEIPHLTLFKHGGVYELFFNKEAHGIVPNFLGLQMSPLGYPQKNNNLSLEDIKKFFDDNVGYEFSDLTIE